MRGKRRSTCKPVDLNVITPETKLPVSMDAFWASSINKTKLQELLRETIINMTSQKKILVSAMGIASEMKPCMSIWQDTVDSVQELDIQLEEADVRMIPHAMHAVKQGARRVVLLSNDTDVMVIALHFLNLLKAHGLQELWIRAGVGNTTRYVPLHTLGEKLGSSITSTLIALHHLTGCDSTSKFGTKAAALESSPEKKLP